MSEDFIGRRGGGHRGRGRRGFGGIGPWGFYTDSGPSDQDLIFLEEVPRESSEVQIINGQIVDTDGHGNQPQNTIGLSFIGYTKKQTDAARAFLKKGPNSGPLASIKSKIAKKFGLPYTPDPSYGWAKKAAGGVASAAKATGRGVKKGAQAAAHATSKAAQTAAHATAHAAQVAAKYGPAYAAKFGKILTYPLRQLAAGVVWGIMAPVRMLLGPHVNKLAKNGRMTQAAARNFFANQLKRSGNPINKLAGKMVEEFGPGTSARVSVTGHDEDLSGADIVAGWSDVIGHRLTNQICGNDEIGQDPASASAMLASVMSAITAALPALASAAGTMATKMALEYAKNKLPQGAQDAIDSGLDAKRKLEDLKRQGEDQLASAQRRLEEGKQQADSARQQAEADIKHQAEEQQTQLRQRAEEAQQQGEAAKRELDRQAAYAQQQAQEEPSQTSTEEALEPSSPEDVQGWSEICGRDFRLKVQTMEYPTHKPAYIKIIDANGPRAFILQIVKGKNIVQARQNTVAFARANNWKITKTERNLIDNVATSTRRHEF